MQTRTRGLRACQTNSPLCCINTSLLFKMAVKIFSQGHLLSNEKLAHSTYWLGLTHAKMGQTPEAMEADKGASKLYYDITGKTIPQSNDSALEAYDSLVLDD